MNEKRNGDDGAAAVSRVDWKPILPRYDVPTVFKEELLRPWMEREQVRGLVLDVGCGTGYFSRILCDRGLRVTGVDMNANLKSDENFEFYKKDFTAFQLRRRFNTILLINILSTLPAADRQGMMDRAQQFKSPGGEVIVVNPHPDLFGADYDSETLTVRALGGGKSHLRIRQVDGGDIEFDDYVVIKEDMRRMYRQAGFGLGENSELKSKYHKKPVFDVYFLG